MTDILAEALTLHYAGYATVRASTDGQKRPLGKWEQYQAERPGEDQVRQWFTSGHHGVGIVCGQVSGNAEMLEFEGRAVAEGVLDEWVEIMDGSGLAGLREKLRGWIEQSPSGGYHIHYRVDGAPVPGNTKLARRPATDDELAKDPKDKIRVLIETRGEGGFVVTAPSNGTTHPSGRPWTLVAGSPATAPTLTADEHNALHNVCRMLDRMPEQEPPRQYRSGQDTGGRPGDDYNTRATWAEILTGWTPVYTRGNVTYWRRPGKNIGVSATTGRNEGDNLYVFSTSTEFDAERPYSKFAAYTLLEHRGDYSAAAKALRADGYGDDDSPPQATTISGTEHPDVDPDTEAAFWEARPILTHLRQAARARMVSPWAVLGVTVARALALTPHPRKLPPIVGAPASLNFAVALVAASGGGKGAAEGCAAEAITCEYIPTYRIGSGEAIAHCLKRRLPAKEGGGTEWRTAEHNVLISMSEVDKLTAQAQRNGATIMPELRAAWSGEDLGHITADSTRAIPIEKMQYRAVLILGVQPGRAAGLLDDADGGFPQRLIWLPAHDPDAPPTDQLPDWPTPINWEPPRGPVYANQHITVCQAAQDEIRQARWRANRGEGDPLDGHRLLAREKVAAALGILDGRYEVREEDWQLAGVVTDKSNAVRGRVQNQLAQAQRESNLARADAEAARTIRVSDRVSEDAIQRVCNSIIRRLRRSPGEWATRKNLRGDLNSRDRKHFDDATERLIKVGQVEVDLTAGNLGSYRLKETK